MKEYSLRIITPTETVFEGNVESLIAPGGKGYLGVLANHAPLDTTIEPGKFIIKQKGKEMRFIVGRGFLEVHHNHVTLVVAQATKM